MEFELGLKGPFRVEISSNEDDKLQEHVVYSLSRAFAVPELRYSHVEKLALAIVYVVQRLCTTFYRGKLL